MKKELSLFLVLLVLLSVFMPVTAGAEATYSQITVDNNRTRIEFTEAVSIAAGASYSVDFTVPIDGNYAFMMNKNMDYYGYISAEVKSGETSVWSVSNAAWTGATSGKNKPYGRVGVGTTGTVALTKDTAYTLTLTPTADATQASGTVSTLTTSYIDVLCVDIVADGKKLIQPYFYKTTGINGDHFLNNADALPTALSYINANLADYTIPGKPADGVLSTGWSFVQATPMPQRTHHIEYHIVAPYDGKYIMKVGGEQYTSGNGAVKETVYFKVDGTQVATATYNGTSEDDKFQVMSAVLDLTAGNHVVRFQRNTTGAWDEGGTHTYMRIPFVTIEPKEAEVIHASDNLTRIETASTVVVADGATKSFDFTVPMDGNYAFLAGTPTTHRQYYGNVKAVLTNLDDNTAVTICESAAWTGTASGARSYRRIGNGTTGTVALTKDTNYSIALTPTAIVREGKQTEVGISYIDVIRTDIPVDGDIVIPTQYYRVSSTSNEHFLNNTDCQTEATTYITNNFPNNRVIGKPDSNVTLATSYSPTAITTILGQTNYMEYTLNVETAGYYEVATRVSVHSGTPQVAYADTIYFSVDGEVAGTGAYNPPSYTERVQDVKTVIYLPAGNHTLKVHRNAPTTGSNSVMYFMFVALSELQPEATMYAESAAEGNEIYSVQDGTMVAQIQTNGTVSIGDTVNAFFAIYDNTKQMVAVDAYTQALESDTITLTISNFKKTEGKTYKAKAFLWNENYWGESFMLAEGLEELIDFTVTVPEGREAVVLQLTDTQTIDASQERTTDRLGATLDAYYAKDQQENRMFKYLRETIQETNPDLILLTGDMVYGEFDDDGSAFLNLVNFMEEMQVPWAPIFGNHEGESALGHDWQCEQLENAEYCLFKQRTLTGNGNYTVGIEQGGKLKRVFFMMDSNGCSGMSDASFANGHSQKATGFAADQVAWFEKVGNQIQSHVPGVKVSFAYHIQMQKFQEAYTKYGYVTGDANSVPINIDTHPDKAVTDFGYIGSLIASGWDTDGTIYNKMKAIGMDSMFIGHLHAESASAIYDGVRFQFGQKSSCYDQTNYVQDDGSIVASYSDAGSPLVGGTVLTVSEEDGSFNETYIYLCEEE